MANANEQCSSFRLLSRGTVAENMALNSEYCEVTLTEVTPGMDGELRANLTSLNTSITNASGKAAKGDATVTTTVRAKWLRRGNSALTTPPNLQRGEQVFVYTLGDKGDMYFEEASDGALRRLETVIWRFSGTPDYKKSLDSTNCYEFAVSTHEKRAYFRTTKANGEKSAFALSVDGGNGQLIITDDAGTIIGVDSGGRVIHFKNGAGSEITLSGNTVTVEADNINFVARSALTLKAAMIKIIGRVIGSLG